MQMRPFKFNFNKSKGIKYLIFIMLLSSWLYWDLTQAGNYKAEKIVSFELTNKSKADQASSTTVAIVRSDDTNLADPVSRDNASISYTTIEEMVRRSLNLIGGIQSFVKSGNTVLIKPNIVEQDSSGSGGVTDVRVVKALVKIIDEIDHGKIKILVGDGSPRPCTSFEVKYNSGQKVWSALYDVPGYQNLKTEMLAAGINFSLTNLNGNFDSLSSPSLPLPGQKLVSVPGGGTSTAQGGQYYISQDIVNADVYITVPVMKIHDPGITCALKNQIGIAPSTVYGFNKQNGVSWDNYAHKLLHFSKLPYVWSDKDIVDLSSIAKIKLAVVDALACLETAKTPKSDNSTLVRMNCIVASADPVATDHVCARLMGLNPDDVEHITLAERQGLGTNDTSRINIVGATINSTKKIFKKSQSTYGNYGQGNRDWLLNGLYQVGSISDPINHEFITGEASLAPKPGINGWTQSTYFTNDRIALYDYYGTSSSDKVVCYLFTYFYAPADQTAELWIGSDEAIKVYINGTAAYTYNSTRTFATSSFFSEIQQVQIQKGWNKLLVKVLQTTGLFDFSLNICDVQSDVNYRGNRVWGLKFKPDTTSSVTGIKGVNSLATGFSLNNCYPNPFNNSVRISYNLPEGTSGQICIYDMLGRKIKTFDGITKSSGSSYTISWDGRNDAGTMTASGTYIVALHGQNNLLTAKKIVLMK
jgi:uncharacterized protein (DUF362 family)